MPWDEKGYRRTKQQIRRDERRAKGLCPCGKAPFVNGYYCQPCIDKKFNKRQTIVKALYDAYGGQCVCCSENRLVFLTIDHVNNDGAEHRKEIGTSVPDIYRWAKANNFPPTLQILCGSCHLAKSRKKICPHKQSLDRDLILAPWSIG